VDCSVFDYAHVADSFGPLTNSFCGGADELSDCFFVDSFLYLLQSWDEAHEEADCEFDVVLFGCLVKVLAAMGFSTRTCFLALTAWVATLARLVDHVATLMRFMFLFWSILPTLV